MAEHWDTGLNWWILSVIQRVHNNV